MPKIPQIENNLHFVTVVAVILKHGKTRVEPRNPSTIPRKYWFLSTLGSSYLKFMFNLSKVCVTLTSLSAVVTQNLGLHSTQNLQDEIRRVIFLISYIVLGKFIDFPKW